MNVVVWKKNWKVNGYETDYITYRRCCRATTKIINEFRRNYHRQKLLNCCDARSRWKAVKKLLHSSDQDNTRSEVENQSLFISFFIFFSTKIQTFKANIKSKLATISPLCPTPEAIFIGQPFFTFTSILLQRSLNCLVYHPLNPASKTSSLHPCLNPAR